MKNTFALKIAGLAAFAIGLSLPAAGHAADVSVAKPQYGAWGYDVAGADKATKPGDDFFRFANGAWLDQHANPPRQAGHQLAPAHDRPHRRPPARHDGAGRRQNAASARRSRRQGRRFLQGVHGRGAHRAARRETDRPRTRRCARGKIARAARRADGPQQFRFRWHAVLSAASMSI